MMPVDRDIYDAVAKAVSPEFAFSYLVKAEQHGRTIIPFTVTAFKKLSGSFYAMNVLSAMNVRLQRPIPFSETRTRLA